MAQPLRVLVVEDSETDEQLLIRELRRQGYDPTWLRVDTEEGMREALSRSEWELVISDYTMPEFSGLGALEILKSSGLDLPFICMSGTIGEDTAVATMKAGAHDYIMKDNLRRLGPAIGRELREAATRRERKRAEKAERETLEELRRSNEELQRFAYVASHDLQEPLRMVSSYTELLAKRYRSRLPADPEMDEFIGYALEGAHRMHRLINDLLAFSRLSAREKSFAPVDGEKVLQHALDNLRVPIRESDALIVHDELPRILGDETQLIQLFQNLIGNAIKFRREIPPRVGIEAREKDGAWLISVSDNGIGIERAHLERIFVIFQRLHGRDEYPGTGIGLALCKKIVERHGGRISVESEPGRGSVFSFTVADATEKGHVTVERGRASLNV
jgi:signal transduction histidine kinase